MGTLRPPCCSGPTCCLKSYWGVCKCVCSCQSYEKHSSAPSWRLHESCDFPNMQADAGKIAECPNYWFQRELIEAGECKTVAEEAIVHLYKSCLQGRLPDSWAGAEWWVQVSD